MNTITITGAAGVHQMLDDYMTPKLPRRMQDATKAAATVFRAPLKAEAAKVSKRLARSVSVRRAARERPATVVTFRPRIAFFRHFIIDGTRDHGPRSAQMLRWESRGKVIWAKHVRGVKSNPIVDRVGARYERAAYDALDKALDKSETT